MKRLAGAGFVFVFGDDACGAVPGLCGGFVCVVNDAILF